MYQILSYLYRIGEKMEKDSKERFRMEREAYIQKLHDEVDNYYLTKNLIL
jgi:hypothetical protein